MSTAFKPLEIPPGVVAMGTKKMRSSNWAEVNNIRWIEGQLLPIGGQTKMSNIVSGVEKYTFATRCKKVHGWYGLDNVYRISYLCEGNLYVDEGGILYDISPTPAIVAPAPLTQGGYGDGVYSENLQLTAQTAWTTSSTTITLTHNASGALATMEVHNLTQDPTGMTSYVGDVASVSGNTVTLAAPALIAGNVGDTLDFDWYGEPRTVGAIFSLDKVPDAFSLDNFGSILYAMTSPDGRLLMWDPATGTSNPAVVQPAATGRGPVPSGRFFVITSERFVVIFGSYNDGTTGVGSGGGPRRFAWCDQENPSAWDYTNVVSQAGFLDIEPAAPILCGDSSRTGILFFTGKKAYRSRFLGLPYVYNYEELADNCTPWSCQSICTTSSMTLWMSKQGMFSFDGTSILPVACMVRTWIDEDIDILNVREQACAVHVSDFNEWWWFFPQNGQPYNTRAIIYNYKEGWWSQARMSRSAGVTSSYNIHTIMADGTIAIEHETPYCGYVNADPPFAETFDLNIAGGGRLVTVKQLLPDIELVGEWDPTDISVGLQELRYSLYYRNSRSVGPAELQSSFQSVTPNGYVNFRTTGRDIRLRVDLPTPMIVPFTIGQNQIDVVIRGDR